MWGWSCRPASTSTRVMHPLDGGRRWSTVAPEYLERGANRHRYPFPDEVTWTEGDMGAAPVDVLLDVLGSATVRASNAISRCGQGWGDLHAGSHSTLHFVGGDLGPLRARWRRRPVRRMRSLQRRAEAPLYEFVAACAVQLCRAVGPCSCSTDRSTPLPRLVRPTVRVRLRRRGPAMVAARRPARVRGHRDCDLSGERGRLHRAFIARSPPTGTGRRRRPAGRSHLPSRPQSSAGAHPTTAYMAAVGGSSSSGPTG